VSNQVGGLMTLTLQEGGGGSLSGSLTSNEVQYRVEGWVEDGMAAGSMSGSAGLLFFEAERWENELWVMLYGSDAGGQPNYEDYTEIDFVAVTSTAGSAGGGQAPGGSARNSGGGGAGAPRNPLGGEAADPFVGTFSDGNVVLTLHGVGGQYQGQVQVGGASYPVIAQSGAQGIQGTIQAPDGQYAIAAQPQGQGLLAASGGMQYSLTRQNGTGVSGGGVTGRPVPEGTTGRPNQSVPPGGAGRTRSGRELAPGYTEDHPQVTEWLQFLAGNKLTTMDSYSSGTAGGYSARTDVYLCSDRSFAMRDESSVSVDVGGAFGNSGGVGGGQGQWYVITNGQVVGLVLEFASGETQEFRLDYDYDDQATYANGTRVYVTPAEVCM